MNVRKVCSLALAMALQVLPITRVFVATAPASGSSIAIVVTWIAGVVALLGSVDAVSGASTIITSPTTARGTNGVAFSYRITTGPQGANRFNAAPLPAGLTVGTATGRITGTPTTTGVYTILLTASDNGSASRTITTNLTLTIVDPLVASPSIAMQPTSQTVIVGNNANFSVVAGGTAPLSYFWRFNGVNIANATNSSLALLAVTTNQAGSYSVVITNSSGSVTSSVATMTVNVPPTIMGQPVGQTVTLGASTSFSVTANGTSPLTYQWKLNGANVGGATSSTLNLMSVTTNQAGSYTVVVSNTAGIATSSAAVLTVNVPVVGPTIITQPTNRTVTVGANASFSVAASGTAPLNYQWRFNGADIGGATNATLNLFSVTTNNAGNYTVVVSNVVNSVTSSVATLTLNPAPVNAAPTITPISDKTMTRGSVMGAIAFAIGDMETTANSLTLTKSSTNLTLLPLANIVFGGSSGNRTVTLTPVSGQVGSSLVTITVSDGTNSSSSSFLLVVQQPITSQPTWITLIISGAGTVIPNLGTQLLTPGRAYTMKAVPAASYEFSGWTGSTNSPVPSANFVMTSNLVFQANFISSPYIPVVGAYNGLFFESDEVRLHSTGFFKLLVTARGNYSGTLRLGNRLHSLSGKLDLSCHATNVIKRIGLSPLTVEIALGTNTQVGQVNGRVTDGNWSAFLSGARNDFNVKTNPAPQAGNYTFAISGRDGDVTLPHGDGFGSMRAMSNGVAMFTGTLADGTPVSCSATLTPDGDWPLYASLYSGGGAVVSWASLNNLSTSGKSGALNWIKKGNPLAKYFPLGFTNETQMIGSYYLYPIGSIATPILNLPAAEISFGGGNLTVDYTNSIAISWYSRVTNLSSNRLSLTFSVARGTFSGTVQNPVTGRSSLFKGAVLQKQNVGAGFLLGTNLSSRVSITAPGP